MIHTSSYHSLAALAKRDISHMMVLAVICSFAVSCVQKKGEPPKNEGLAYYQVHFAPGTELGSYAQPLPFQAEHEMYIAVTAHDHEHQLMSDYSGQAEIQMQAAKLTSVMRVQFEQGKVQNFRVAFSEGVGKERISVHEVVQGETTDGLPALVETGRLGVSKEIYLANPDVVMIQSTHDNSASQGFNSFYNGRNLTIKGHELVVLAVIEGGFYMQQLNAPEYGTIYLYTHSTPYVDDTYDRHALEAGTIIEEVNGSVFEFFGFTEMSFPTFVPKRDASGAIVADESLIPDPVNITDYIDNGQDVELEKRESGLVTIDNVTVDNFDENDESYVQYNQFPLQTENGGYIMAVTIYTAPSFRPGTNKGTVINSMTGVLKQHRSARPSKWILVPRGIEDIDYQQ